MYIISDYPSLIQHATHIHTTQVLMAIGASLIVIGGKKRFRRVIPIDRNFFVGYRRVSLEPDEVVLAVRIPLTKRHEYVMAYKQARRREDDIAIVNGAFRVLLEVKADGMSRSVRCHLVVWLPQRFELRRRSRH